MNYTQLLQYNLSQIFSLLCSKPSNGSHLQQSKSEILKCLKVPVVLLPSPILFSSLSLFPTTLSFAHSATAHWVLFQAFNLLTSA